MKTTLKEFIVDTAQPSPDEIVRILQEHCSQSLASQNKLYRGSGDKRKYFVLDPSARQRTSLTGNQFMLNIASNAPTWSSFPKRNNSTFMTSNIKTATLFGHNGVVRVFPFDDAVLAVAPKEDFNYEQMWGYDLFGAKLSNEELSGVVGILVARHLSENRKLITGHVNYANLTSTLNTVFNDMKKERPPNISNAGHITDHDMEDIFTMDNGEYNFHELRGFADILEADALRRGSLVEAVLAVTEPIKSGFKLTNVKNLTTNGDQEVWTSSKCVMIDCGAIRTEPEFIKLLNN